MTSPTPRASAPPSAGSVDAIKDAILSGLYEGHYQLGQRLIEAELTARYGVSRSSVREALQRLAADGMVEITRHRGAFIRSLSRTDVVQILTVTELFMGLAARLAASAAAADTGAGDAVAAAFGRLKAAGGQQDHLAFMQARTDYYAELIRVGGNRELARYFPGMHHHLLRIQFRGYESADDHRIVDFQQITEAVQSGDGQMAELVARAHIRRVLHSIERLPLTAFETPLK